MYKEDFALNNLQWLICQKTKPNKNKFIDFLTNDLINFMAFLGTFILIDEYTNKQHNTRNPQKYIIISTLNIATSKYLNVSQGYS